MVSDFFLLVFMERKKGICKHSDCQKKVKEMKIQCDACEKSPATVICCADEAALCASCDVEIHAANKLASKHQRLLLQCLSNKLPRCDICQVMKSTEAFLLIFMMFFLAINSFFMH